MKQVSGQTFCPCGVDLHFKIGKPTRITPQTTSFRCPKCLSTYLAKAEVDDNRKVKISFGVQQISPACEAIIQKAIDERGRGSREAKSGRADKASPDA